MCSIKCEKLHLEPQRRCANSPGGFSVMVICFPIPRIVRYVLSNFRQFVVAPDDVVVVITLPNRLPRTNDGRPAGLEGRPAGRPYNGFRAIDAYCNRRFVSCNERAQSPRPGTINPCCRGDRRVALARITRGEKCIRSIIGGVIRKP